MGKEEDIEFSELNSTCSLLNYCMMLLFTGLPGHMDKRPGVPCCAGKHLGWKGLWRPGRVRIYRETDTRAHACRVYAPCTFGQREEETGFDFKGMACTVEEASKADRDGTHKLAGCRPGKADVAPARSKTS